MPSEGQSFEGLNSRLKYISKADTSVFTFGSYFAVMHSQNYLVASYIYSKPWAIIRANKVYLDPYGHSGIRQYVKQFCH